MLNKVKLCGSGFCQCKNDYGIHRFILNGLFFLATKRIVLTIEKYGIIQAHKRIKGYTDIKRSLDHVQCFKNVEGGKISVLLPKNWKKSFSGGIVIPT